MEIQESHMSSIRISQNEMTNATGKMATQELAESAAMTPIP